MSLDLDVYCKRQPDAGVIQRMLDAQLMLERNGRTLLNWSAAPNGIEIWVPQYATPFTRELDDERLDAANARAAASDYVAPQRFYDLLRKGGEIQQREILEQYGHLSPLDPPSVLRVNDELCALLAEHPELPEAFPEFNPGWDMAAFSAGQSLYAIRLDTFISAHAETVQCMAGLAVTLADQHAGIIYDPQRGKLGTPDANSLARSGQQFFQLISNALESGALDDIALRHLSQIDKDSPN